MFLLLLLFLLLLRATCAAAFALAGMALARAAFAFEYEKIKGIPYKAPNYEPIYYGSIKGPAKLWVSRLNDA